MTEHPPSHFQGKTAVDHVAHAQAAGLIAATEIHGTEVPGPIAAGADAARDTSIALLLLHCLPPIMAPSHGLLLVAFSAGWLVWKVGRASWLGWSRLERLHRLLEQERWEIEHNRPQERDELRELYRAKGFEGKLLEDVLDVLMADGERLLKVMVEEELGLSLENMEHPLKQGLGAGIGTLLVSIFLIFCSHFGFIILSTGALFSNALASLILAYYARNRLIPAIVWNTALAVMAMGMTLYLLA